MSARGLGAGDDNAFGDGHARSGEHGLGAFLVHGKRRGEHARMGVRDAHGLEHALDAAVFAKAAVKCVEADIGLELGETRRNVVADIEEAHAIALRFESVATGLAGAERDLPFRRQPAHQHCDMNLLFCH